MINPAPGFWSIFGPLGPTAGPGSEIVQVAPKSAPETNSKARSWVLWVFGAGRKKIKIQMANLRLPEVSPVEITPPGP